MTSAGSSRVWFWLPHFLLRGPGASWDESLLPWWAHLLLLAGYLLALGLNMWWFPSIKLREKAAQSSSTRQHLCSSSTASIASEDVSQPPAPHSWGRKRRTEGHPQTPGRRFLLHLFWGIPRAPAWTRGGRSRLALRERAVLSCAAENA